MGRTNMIRNGDCGIRTKEIIARYYIQWANEFIRLEDKRLYLSMDKGDIYHNAITMILQDDRFRSIDSDDEIISMIKKRIKDVAMGIYKDHYHNKRMEIGGNYADNIQTEGKQGQGKPEEEGKDGDI